MNQQAYNVSIPVETITNDANRVFVQFVQGFGSDLIRESQLLADEEIQKNPGHASTGITEPMVRSANESLRKPTIVGPAKKSWKLFWMQILSLASTLAVGVLGSYLKDSELVRNFFYLSLLIALVSAAYILRKS